AIDSSGNAYVVGRVDSKSTDFPTTPGSLATSYRGGDFDGIVFKLNAQGNALVYSSYLGGEENDSVEGIAVDANGVAYVTGGTKSNAFPITMNAYQSTRAGDTDAFLAKINPAGSALLYSSFIGGAATDRGSGVVIDGNGLAYIAGYGASPDFPTENPFQAGFGGSGDDRGTGMAVNSSGVYVTGFTSSPNLPTVTPLQLNNGGGFDAFVAKLNLTGSSILYSTYLGGTANENFVAAVTGTNPI